MDMFNNGNNKTLQSVIDAASKILMGVQDQSVADAQTEDQHPIAQARMAEAKMKMKMKEKMDPVGKEDDDVDNDGDSDDSDDYLKARRKAISKKVAKEEMRESIEDDHEHAQYRVQKHLDQVKSPKHKANFQKQFNRHKFYYDHNYDNDTGQEHEVVSDMHHLADTIKKHNSTAMKKEQYVREAEDLDTTAVDKALAHDCAKHVVHEFYGNGECISGMHTIEESADGEAYVTHYDVMFQDEDGVPYILEDVAVEDLEVTLSESHMHTRKKKK